MISDKVKAMAVVAKAACLVIRKACCSSFFVQNSVIAVVGSEEAAERCPKKLKHSLSSQSQ